MELSVLIALGIGIAVGAAIHRTLANGGTEDLAAEAERLRMQLSACGVAAMGNTASAVGRRIECVSPYWSQSYSDVCAAVDREIALRDARDTEVRQFIGWLSVDVPELHRVEVPRLAESWERFQTEQAIARAGAG